MKKTEKKINISSLIYFIVFLIIFCTVSLFSYIIETSTEKQKINEFNIKLEEKLRKSKNDLENIYISKGMINKNLLNTYLKNNEQDFDKELNEYLEDNILNKKNISQIRIIDKNGREILRRNIKNNNIDEIIVNENLQNKSNRYYVNEAFQKNLNEIYFSKIDLNIENNRIQEPHILTLRSAIKFLKNNQEYIFIINYDITNSLKSIFNLIYYDLFLLTEKGEISFHLDENYYFPKQLNINNSQNILNKKLKKEYLYFNNSFLLITVKNSIIKNIHAEKIEKLINWLLISLMVSLLISTIISYLIKISIKKFFNRINFLIRNNDKEYSIKEQNFIEFESAYEEVKDLILYEDYLKGKIQKELEYNRNLMESLDVGLIIVNHSNNILDFNFNAGNIFDKIKINLPLEEVSKELFKYINENIDENDFLIVDKNYYKVNYKLILENKYLISLEKTTNQINQKLRMKKIFNTQNSILVITNGKNMINVNDIFFKTFGFDDLTDFKEKYKCICELFQEKGTKEYLQSYINDLNWLEHINKYPQNIHLASILDKNGEEKIYKVNPAVEIFENEFLVEFSDITIMENQKDTIQNQIRFVAMGEIISMIAHQWKQPLSTMSAIISNLNLKKEMNLLSDEYWEKSLSKHNELTKFMNKTIEDFMSFFRNSSTEESFAINDLINRTYNLIEPLYSKENIKFIIKYNIDEKYQIKTKSSKLDQVLLNLYKNSFDEFVAKEIKNAQISVTISKSDEYICINVADNAGGIPENIINKIFDPYFSTKSKNGTGIGLYMSKIIIEQQLNGKLEVNNISNGVLFTIFIPNK